MDRQTDMHTDGQTDIQTDKQCAILTIEKN